MFYVYSGQFELDKLCSHWKSEHLNHVRVIDMVSSGHSDVACDYCARQQFSNAVGKAPGTLDF